MRVSVTEEGRGIHPNEVVVSIATADGTERLVVHRRSIVQGALEIGYPIFQEGDKYLVELPRETMRGLWRVWVEQNSVFDSQERQTA